MRSAAAVLVLGLLVQAPAPSPLEGRWTADLAASKMHKGTAVRSIALTFAVEPNRVRITDDVISEAGKPIGTGTVEFIPDDQDHPNDALIKGLVIRARWATPRRFETVFRRASGVVERVNYEVSPDGATLINTTDGPLGSQRIVFRRAATTQTPAPRGGISDLQWLAGVWRSEDKAVTIEERWTPPSGGAMLATNRTIKGDRMAAFEFLRIVERGRTLVYIAQPGGRPPVEFTATKQSARSITFENPKHDFPKVIEYTLRPDGRLEARVSDGAKTEERFVFARASD